MGKRDPLPSDALTLFQGLGTDYSTSSMAQRDRLLNANQRLEQTNDRLASGKKMLAETDVSFTGLGDFRLSRTAQSQCSG